MGLFTDHPLFIDISPALVVILVSDLPSLSAPLLMCGIAKKAVHLFLNLQGSFFYPISSSSSRLLLSCKPQKELGTRLFAIGDKEALYSKTVF